MCRSTMGDFVVTADDPGHVRLLNCPSLIEHAPSRHYAGHSSHVMCVRFSPDDKRVVSVGGKDRAVFQWRTHALVGLQGDGTLSGRDFEKDGPRYKCEIDGCRICGRGFNATGPIVPRAPWDGGELRRL
jgi:WD40 repeat protein